METIKTFIISFFICLLAIIAIGVATFIVVMLSRLVITASPNFGSIIVGIVLISGLLAGFMAMGANDKVG